MISKATMTPPIRERIQCSVLSWWPRRKACVTGAAVLCALGVGVASAQTVTYELGDDGSWDLIDAAEPGSPQAVILSARRALARGEAKLAYQTVDDWLAVNQNAADPWRPDALLTRGDALVARKREYDALFDYEEIVRLYPASDRFTTALERQYEVARRYINGMRRKVFGLRIEPSTRLGEELLIRIQERLPGSALAERAAFTLGEYYFEKRDLALAAEMYEIIIANFPRSERVEEARQRRIYVTLAGFKGPAYDGARLTDARLLIDDLLSRSPEAAAEAGVNIALRTRVEESAAAHKLDTAAWYLRTGDDVSAEFLLRRIIRDYPLTASAQRSVAELEARGWLEPEEGDIIEFGPASGVGEPDAQPEIDPQAVPAADAPEEAGS